MNSGTPLSISATGLLNADIEEGATLHLQVKYGLITIIKTTIDLCENVQRVNLTCPLKKDKKTTLSKEVDLPKEIPPGKYTVTADLETKDSDRITCLTAQVEFHREKKSAVEGVEQRVMDAFKVGL